MAAARPLVAALAAVLVGLGCSSAASSHCPGIDLGGLHLAGARTAASCTAGGPANGFDDLYPATLAFDATFAHQAQGDGAALCLNRPGADPFQGTTAAGAGGDQLDVAADTTGAVLVKCAAGCAVSVRQTISGTLTLDPVTRAPTAFSGTLTEVATAEPLSDCAPCTLPCGATWALTGAP